MPRLATTRRRSLPRLRGPRVLLTGLDLAHVHQHFRWNNDPELNRLDSELPFEREAFGPFAARFERMVYAPRPGDYDFEIHVEDGDKRQLVGVAFLAGAAGGPPRARIGVTLGERSAWGQGYGSEALRVLLDFAFGKAGLHRVTADAFSFNEAWCRTLLSVGFRKEGHLRDHLHRDDIFYDQILFGLLAHEHAASGDGAAEEAEAPAVGERG